MSVFGSRVYIFGVHSDGDREFLHTTLDRQEAVDYIVKFRSVFPKQFSKFVYGNLIDAELTEVDHGED